eukprot:1428953-Pleurochrysis_carterae.AAC.4
MGSLSAPCPALSVTVQSFLPATASRLSTSATTTAIVREKQRRGPAHGIFIFTNHHYFIRA